MANFVARQNASACGFTPSFPATSPYCVSVGATQGPEAGTAEVACTSATGGLITTGGGFSIYVNRPDWCGRSCCICCAAFVFNAHLNRQADVVDNYLKTGPNVPPRSMFSSLGRAYPDISVVG